MYAMEQNTFWEDRSQCKSKVAAGMLSVLPLRTWLTFNLPDSQKQKGKTYLSHKKLAQQIQPRQGLEIILYLG